MAVVLGAIACYNYVSPQEIGEFTLAFIVRRRKDDGMLGLVGRWLGTIASQMDRYFI